MHLLRMSLQGPVDQTALEERRLKAVRLFENGITPSEVARRLAVHRQSAGRWRKEWEQGGNRALASKGHIGRKRALSEEQEQQLAGILMAGAVAAGMPTEVWTLPRVAKVILNEFGVGYHPAHVSKVLAAMGFSCQRTTRRLIERDEDKIRHLKLYPSA